MEGDWKAVPPPPGGGWQQQTPAPAWQQQTPAPAWQQQTPAPAWQQQTPAPAWQAPQLRPLGLGDVLDGMFKILTRNWRTFLIALGAVLVPVNLLTAIVQRNLGGGVGFVEMFRNPAAFQAAASAQPTMVDAGIAALVGLVVAVLVTPYLYGVCCAVAADSWQRGARPGPGEVLAQAAGRFWSLVGAFLLGYLAVAAVFLPAGIVLGAGGLTENVALLVVGALLFLPLALLALAVGLLLLLAAPAIIAERLGPVAGLKRSVALMRRRFWPRAGTLVLAYVVTSLAGAVLGIPFGLVGAAFGGTVGVVFTALSGILTGLLTTPLIASAVTLVYLDGRIRSEGLDIQAHAAGLGGAQGTQPPPSYGGSPGW